VVEWLRYTRVDFKALGGGPLARLFADDKNKSWTLLMTWIDVNFCMGILAKGGSRGFRGRIILLINEYA
jgi:hypothetical protein